MDLKNRRALVTGASSGIGAATVQALREAGAQVAAAARRTDRLDGDLNLTLDVTDEASIRTAVDAAAADFGGLDLVVNAAGIMPLGPVAGADTTIWRRCLDTNLLGMMLVTHAALPHLTGDARDIVNISSIGGRETYPGAAVYHATKFGLYGFSDALRKELAPSGVRVSVVEPGYTDTELFTSIGDPERQAALAGVMATQRNLAGADVAAAILHIVSRPPHVLVNNVQIRPSIQA
ncbi:SDR family NAD(P)-dependent oxidoreductase [Actinoplanes sp. LDG1-06]|uniref:SDR family NAD(P)-dependent oxidoreductase n=1 Tax=Paractinoplanes ovalisporus TaxID=2810368 RepID=A0ABS2A8N4_9ACTN|nr:SDR family NAD(P)-dependent oxidoreductase [Actinoplanes ovalisporus]MBM2615591.1 SDR family NAD(P)-dependent oxidoreductase [Actinoplanes ovalisporus]